MKLYGYSEGLCVNDNWSWSGAGQICIHRDHTFNWGRDTSEDNIWISVHLKKCNHPKSWVNKTNVHKIHLDSAFHLQLQMVVTWEHGKRLTIDMPQHVISAHITYTFNGWHGLSPQLLTIFTSSKNPDTARWHI